MQKYPCWKSLRNSLIVSLCWFLIFTSCAGTQAGSTKVSSDIKATGTHTASITTTQVSVPESVYPPPQVIRSPELTKPVDSPTPVLQFFVSTQNSPYPPPGVTPASPMPSLTEVVPTLTVQKPTPGATSTVGVIPTESIPGTALPPPSGLSSTISIWHSWSENDIPLLEAIIQAFQKIYPDVSFSLSYIPIDDLLKKYEMEVYNGDGPSLLLGPADWGPLLDDKGLVTDLSTYTSSEFLSLINQAALGSGQYQGKLVSLPYAIQGVVMYRNKLIIPTAPATFDELVSLSKAATKGGVIGADLERGAYYSVAHLEGIGGRLMDDNGNPIFNEDGFRYGVEWLDLLKSFTNAGATEFNSDRDVQLFKRGKVGIIFGGTWDRDALAHAIGLDNLAIDPWLKYGEGHLSGYVQSNNLFVKTNITGNDLLAVLKFVGFCLAPEVQTRFAEYGFIPSVKNASARDPFIKQAMVAMGDGVTYPILPANSAYWDALQSAMVDVFDQGLDPKVALQGAYDEIINRLKLMQGVQ